MKAGFEAAYLTFGLDRVGVLRDYGLLGEPLWKYLASLIYLLLAIWVSRLIDFVVGVWLKRLAVRTTTKLDDLLLDLLHGPVKIVVLVLLLHVGLTIFDWSPKVQVYLSKGLTVVVAGALTYLAVKITAVLLDLWQARIAHEDRRFNNQLFSFLRKSLFGFVIVVAVLVTAQNLGINMTAAITSLSIGGLAVGLAAQDTLGNLFGAIAVLTDKPFQVGDTIKLDTTEGVVEAVGLRSTRVRNADGHVAAIPNKAVGNATVVNISLRPSVRTTMNLALARTLPAEKIKQALSILEEIYKANAITQDVWISFNQFAGANINILVIHWSKGSDYRAFLTAMQEMNLAVKERFDQEGITFA